MADEKDFLPAGSPLSFDELYSQTLSLLKEKNLHRILPTPSNTSNILDFSTNDYLNLSSHPALLQAAYTCGTSLGMGSTGSRLLSGNKSIFEKFEERIARDKKCEAALIFCSGFQANCSALATLCNKKTLKSQAILFFDKYAHSSLYQAAFLAGAHLVRYRHNDMEDLEKLLARYESDPRKKCIITETVFGMDGDISPLETLVSLAKKSGALLYLDEAHATGVFGYGLSTKVDLSSIPHVVMGTFSKALGAFGAYIATSSVIKEYLVNTCPGFIFSTALPPPVIAAAYEAWEMLPRLSSERKMLLQHATYLRSQLQELGFNTGSSSTHIIPIILGSETRTLQAKELLAKENIIVSAIRPPSVPPGTSRLRIALTAKHTQEDIETLITAVKKV